MRESITDKWNNEIKFMEFKFKSWNKKKNDKGEYRLYLVHKNSNGQCSKWSYFVLKLN